jgi:hypothetical protein
MQKLFAVMYLLYLCAVAAACFVPDLIEMGFHTDKMMHITFICLAFVWPCLSFKSWRPIFILAIGILIGGIGIEILQGFTPDRKPEIEDVIANTLGVGVGLMIGYLLRSGYYAEYNIAIKGRIR